MTDQFIGRGEKVAVKILEKTFPYAGVTTQIPIRYLVKKEIFEMYDESYKKATIDIVMINNRQDYAIRIQDKHHTSKRVSVKDRIQREDMEDNGKIVIDIFERESPFLFRNILDYRSSVEVLLPLKMAKVKP